MSDPEAIISRAVALGAGEAERSQAAEELVQLSAGRREDLEAARDHFVARLHKDSADYDATNGLLVVNAALSRVGYPTGTDD